MTNFILGKKQNYDICPKLNIDSWEEEVFEEDGSVKKMKDNFKGKEVINEVFKKKYLGDMITIDGTNHINIKRKNQQSSRQYQ